MAYEKYKKAGIPVPAGMKEEAFNALSERDKEIISQVIAGLERGAVPWRKTWDAVPQFGECQNAVTGTKYRGGNSLRLLLASVVEDYTDPRWLTFNQMTDKGYNFKKDENGDGVAKGKGIGILNYQRYDTLTKKPFDPKAIAHLSFTEQAVYETENVKDSVNRYTVFNASLVAGIEAYALPDNFTEQGNELADRIIAASGVPIVHDGGGERTFILDNRETKTVSAGRAFYSQNHEIHMPPKESFHSESEYRATLLHEIVHSTAKTLNRETRHNTEGDETVLYAREELVAEFGSVFLQIRTGVKLPKSHIENHAAYLLSWAKLLKDDPRLIFSALSEAAKACDYLAGRANAREQVNAQEKNNEPTGTPPSPEAVAGGYAEAGLTKGAADDPRYDYIYDEDGALSSAQEKAPGVPSAGDAPAATGAVGNVPAWILVKRSKTLANIEANIPPEMRALPNWCAFNSVFVRADPNGKTEKDRENHYNKLIWNCNNIGEKHWASPTDPATWANFDTALKFARENGCDGLSFSLTKESRVFCIDLDKCKGADGKYSPLAWEINNSAHNTYAERSISGKGLHFFGIKGGSLDTHPIFDGAMGNKSADGKLELYDGARFMSVTGDLFMRAKKSLATFTENDRAVATVKGQLSERQAVIAAPKRTSPSLSSFPKANEVIERIRKSTRAAEFNRLYAGEDTRGDRSVSDYALCNIAAFFSDGDAGVTREIFTSSGLYRETGKARGYVDRTVNKAIADLPSRIKPPKGSGNPGK